jgi:uncharacterized membrane-anchored protein
MKLSIWPFFILLVCVQLIVPGSMIWKKEMILIKGKSYKFLTAPIDPYHPFVGKYIVLNFREEAYTLPSKQDIDDDAPVYITFKNNKNGFAEIDKVTQKAPQGSDYLETNVSRIDREKGQVTVFINYPFNRFYMEESKAPEAEMTYGAASLDTSSKVYALVALYKGNAAIKNVYVNDTTITDMLLGNRKLRAK